MPPDAVIFLGHRSLFEPEVHQELIYLRVGDPMCHRVLFPYLGDCARAKEILRNRSIALTVTQVLLVNAARSGVVLFTQARRHADDLAHAAAGAHHADGAEGFVGDADVAPGHEEVGDVARVETAVRNPKRHRVRRGT